MSAASTPLLGCAPALIRPYRLTETGDRSQVESCPPYATRAADQFPLVFSHFASGVGNACSGDIALMRTKGGEEDNAHFLPLDDGEVFANNHLAIHLRQCGVTTLEDDFELPTTRLARPLQPRTFDFLNSIRIATSLDRFFRSWFIDPVCEPDWSTAWSPSAPSTPTSSPESTPWTSREGSPSPFFEAAGSFEKRPTRSRRIRTNQSATSALSGAHIECVQVPASAADYDHPDSFFYSPIAGTSPPGSRFHSSPTSTPRVYEYYFKSIEMDVGKVVVAAEENFPTTIYPKPGRAAASSAPYIFML